MAVKNALVLLVEDDTELRTGLTALCTAAGCKVVAASGASQALGELDRTPFDAVIVEHALASGGLELARRLRARDPSLPILMTSAIYTQPEAGPRETLPFDAFVPRPFSNFELLETLEAVLEGRSLVEPTPASMSQLPMQGALERTPFEALLYKLFDTKFTGRLQLVRGKSEHALYFLRGFPAWATSTTRTEALGTLLVRRGLLDTATLNEFLRRPSHRGASLGQRLVAAGILTNAQLLRALEEQVRERILSWFTLNDGTWTVESGDAFVYRYDVYVQNPIELIFQGVAAFEEINALAARLKERADHVLVPTRNFARLLPYVTLDEQRIALLQKIDGSRRLGQLIQHWRGSFPDFFRFIWSLHATRIVYASPTPVKVHEDLSLDAVRVLAPHVSVFLRVEQARRDGAHSDPSALSGSTSQPGTSPSPTVDQARVPSAIHVSDSSERIDELLELHDFVEHLNHFDLFGLTLDASPDEIRVAIGQRVSGLDPELIKALPPEDVRRIAAVGRRIKEAAAVLLDPRRREAYREAIIAELDAAEGHGVDGELERGRQLLEDGKYDEARAILAPLSEQNRVDARAAALLARCIHLANPADKRGLNSAKALLYRAIALDDRLADAHYYLAAIELKLGHSGQAMECVERTLELDPVHRDALELKALLSGDTGGTMPIIPGLFTKP